MRKRANLFLIFGAVLASQLPFPGVALADASANPGERAEQAGEDRWIPSLTIMGGVIIDTNQSGSVNSTFFRNNNLNNPRALRGLFTGDDNAVAPFVGGSLELMSPALPIATRPRVFLSGEILPTFAVDRALAIEGDPVCVRGPEPDAPCARDEDGSRDASTAFGEDDANGQGSRTTARVDTLVYGMNLGVAFPLTFRERQLRIKPSLGWINYSVEADGFVVDADCNPSNQCTDVQIGGVPEAGFLREALLSGGGSKAFNGIGPGLDVEMDTGHFGPLGVSLFLGARAYYVVGDRKLAFSSPLVSFNDELGNDSAIGDYDVEVDQWLIRTHVGIRLMWLGNRE